MQSIPDPVFLFAEALRGLVSAATAVEMEAVWSAKDLDALGWEALGHAWAKDDPDWHRALEEADTFLQLLLDRVPLIAAHADRIAEHTRTFRLPELERLHHATAAALVVQRFGVAGLRTVLADEDAPLARRYFAFLALAQRHPRGEWPVFAKYLTPIAHHAFVGTAAEAARFYPGTAAESRLVALFERVRSDRHLRDFLGPRILESLYVVGTEESLAFWRDLLTGGYAHPDPLRCEVTHALVMIRRLTGAIEPSVKFPDPADVRVADALDEAEEAYRREWESLTPVAVI